MRFCVMLLVICLTRCVSAQYEDDYSDVYGASMSDCGWVNVFGYSPPFGPDASWNCEDSYGHLWPNPSCQNYRCVLGPYWDRMCPFGSYEREDGANIGLKYDDFIFEGEGPPDHPGPKVTAGSAKGPWITCYRVFGCGFTCHENPDLSFVCVRGSYFIPLGGYDYNVDGVFWEECE
ncbi:MAG: hypothetical protein AAF989_15060 [Planctomycetota bacterium]